MSQYDGVPVADPLGVPARDHLLGGVGDRHSDLARRIRGGGLLVHGARRRRYPDAGRPVDSLLGARCDDPEAERGDRGVEMRRGELLGAERGEIGQQLTQRQLRLVGRGEQLTFADRCGVVRDQRHFQSS